MVVSSIVKIMDMPTPSDLIAWLDTTLTQLALGTIQATIENIESRHGKPKTHASSVIQDLMREDARVRHSSDVPTQRVKQAGFRSGLESNVGDLCMPKDLIH